MHATKKRQGAGRRERKIILLYTILGEIPPQTVNPQSRYLMLCFALGFAAEVDHGPLGFLEYYAAIG